MRRLLFIALVTWCALAQAQILPGILGGSIAAGGGGVTAPTADGAGGTYGNDIGRTDATTTSFSSTTANDFVVCMLSLGTGSGAQSGIAVSGSTLGSFTELQGAFNTASSLYMYAGVWAAQASGTLSSETVTATWTGSSTVALYCQPYSHAVNLLTKTKNTDYAAASAYNHNSAVSYVAITSIGTSNSILVGAFSSWWQPATTPTAITTFKQSTLTQGVTMYSSAVSAGSHNFGGTSAADYTEVTGVELLGQ